MSLYARDVIKPRPYLLSAIGTPSLRRLGLFRFDLSADDLAHLPIALDHLELWNCGVAGRSSHPTITTLVLRYIDPSPMLDGLTSGDWPNLKTITLGNRSLYSPQLISACKSRGIKLFDVETGAPFDLD